MQSYTIIFYIYVFFTGFLISVIMTPISIRLAPKIGAMDIPEDDRRIHKKPIPRVGGIAIFLGSIGSLFFFYPFNFPLNDTMLKMIGLMIGATLIFIMGLVDDIKGLTPKVKLAGQIICSAIIFIFGVRITYVGIPFSVNVIEFPLIISFLATLTWLVIVTNTINLVDGLDGLAGGITIIASLSLAYVAFSNDKPEVAIITAAVAGGSAGFLPFNFNPAKTFMGDSGSLFLGFMLAGVSIIGPMKGAATVTVVVPLLVLGFPLIDTVLAVLRRYITGQPIMRADKGHIHHRILQVGISQRKTVLILYCISGMLGVVAILLSKGIRAEASLLLLFTVGLIGVFFYRKEDTQSVKNDTNKEGS